MTPMRSAGSCASWKTWQAIRANHPQIPPVVISSPAEPTANRPAGATAPRTLASRPRRTHRNHGQRRRPAARRRRVLGTLLHEAAHALSAARGIQDTSRQGRYHNKKFKACAEELGISVEHDPRLGWSITTLPAQTATKYAVQLAACTPR